MPDTPKISIFSCGWSEGSEFKEMLLSQGAFLFDISNIQSDHDAHAPRWKHFGGDGSDLDEELGQIHVLRDLVTRLKDLIQCYMEAIDCNRVSHNLNLVVVCNWGKHRSSWVVETILTWFNKRYARRPHMLRTMHCSKAARLSEIRHYDKCIEKGVAHADAIRSAKAAGFRQKRKQFTGIQEEVWGEMQLRQKEGKTCWWFDIVQSGAGRGLMDWYTDELRRAATLAPRLTPVPPARPAAPASKRQRQDWNMADSSVTQHCGASLSGSRDDDASMLPAVAAVGVHGSTSRERSMPGGYSSIQIDDNDSLLPVAAPGRVPSMVGVEVTPYDDTVGDWGTDVCDNDPVSDDDDDDIVIAKLEQQRDGDETGFASQGPRRCAYPSDKKVVFFWLPMVMSPVCWTLLCPAQSGVIRRHSSTWASRRMTILGSQ